MNVSITVATAIPAGSQYCGVSDRYKDPDKQATPPAGGGYGVADIVSVNGQPGPGIRRAADHGL